jgi:phage shock protein C
MSRRDYFDGVGERELGLDPQNKKLGGVCAGVAHYLDVPSLFVRVGAVVGLCLIPEATLIAYGVAYLILDDLEDQGEYLSD